MKNYKRKRRAGLHTKCIIVTPEIMSRVNPKNFELIDEYFEYAKAMNRTQNTMQTYLSSYNVFFCWNQKYNKNKYFLDVTKGDYRRFLTYGINELNWSPHRCRNQMVCLSSLANYCIEFVDEAVEKGFTNQVKGIKLPELEAVKEKTKFTKKELQHILQKLVEMKKYDIACCVALAMSSGRSICELVQFKADWFNERNLVCRDNLIYIPEPITMRGGKTQKQVYVYMPTFKPYLDLWMKERKEKHIGSQWLFLARPKDKYINRPISVSALQNWKGVIDEITPNKRFYWDCLREYFKEMLQKQDLPTEIIMEITGWAPKFAAKTKEPTKEQKMLASYFDDDGFINDNLK